MPLKGNLRDFSTTQLLNLINLARKTGTLTIDAPGEAASMSFREGKLIFAQLGNEEASLVYVLRNAGKLTEEQARALRQRPEAANDKALGLLLINAGYVTQAEILQGIKQHVLDVAFRLFTWVEGLFNFDAALLPPDDRITVPVDLENVIIEGSRRLREWEQLETELPNLDMALKFTDKPDARLQKVNLNVEEWKVVSYINPKNSIRQIAKANNMNDVDIRRIVYGLLQAGLVELVRPAGMPAGAIPGGGTRKPMALGSKDKEQDKSLVNRLITRIRSL
ncbi:MAG: DUF4388 domain-containing protein [Chloroflexota bacterium]